MVKREACRVVGRDHEADEREQAEAVVQNRRVVHPAAEVVKQLTYIVQNRRHIARGGRHAFFHPEYAAGQKRQRAEKPQKADDENRGSAAFQPHHAACAKADRAEGVADKIASHRAEHLVVPRLLFKRHRRQPEQKRHQHAERHKRNCASARAHRRVEEISQKPRQNAEP